MFKPPREVQKQARLGLELRRKYKRGGLTNKEASKYGIGSGVQRAVNLSNGDELSLETVKRMKAFFDRHRIYKEKGYHDTGNSASYISWLLWGGDPGYKWAKEIVSKNQTEDMGVGQLVRDLEGLLKRDQNDRVMIKNALSTGKRAIQQIETLLAGGDADLASWMEYKVYQATDGLRSVRDSLLADRRDED